MVLQTRAEQDEYIRQLEQEGRGQEVYGKGMQLVTPTAAFVAKTANKQSGQKIFINVCTSDKVCPSVYLLFCWKKAATGSASQRNVHVLCPNKSHED